MRQMTWHDFLSALLHLLPTTATACIVATCFCSYHLRRSSVDARSTNDSAPELSLPPLLVLRTLDWDTAQVRPPVCRCLVATASHRTRSSRCPLSLAAVACAAAFPSASHQARQSR
ncbi:hypothetical protein BD289DRAFT_186771 [Coniella lustricola]|uniref:Secreted protein n=1 Tax=Coniella lustricola TaxID=2025994 RepID=A0A2T3AD57_9PEZI|nr:hypothetical protein BD289DRAFT_186771 [Coniella lustricola]